MITREQALRMTPKRAWMLSCALVPYLAAGLCVLWDHRDELGTWLHDLAPVRRP